MLAPLILVSPDTGVQNLYSTFVPFSRFARWICDRVMLFGAYRAATIWPPEEYHIFLYDD